ncbi:hypothetical protein PENTCL1PPCAC_12069, partial [Pristionchus entomophagus]
RFNQFFSFFSRIDTLGLNNFIDPRGYVQIQQIMENMTINRLEIRVDSLYMDLQIQILGLCRKNNIRNVVITVNPGGMIDQFRNKLCTESEFGVTLDVCERIGNVEGAYFGQWRRFWNEMDVYLRKKGIKMQMNLCNDNGFDHDGYARCGVRSHIRCERMDRQNMGVIRPISLSRGFLPK